MRPRACFAYVLGLTLTTGIAVAQPSTPAAPLPRDVRANHWAASSVRNVLSNGILAMGADKQFHGEAKMTRAQTVIALARLAHKLEDHTWKASASVPVSNKVITPLQKGDWKKHPVSRYTFAYVTSRYADYITNGLPPAENLPDKGKSAAIPAPAMSTLPATNPAHDALVYLVQARMIWPKSPLLKADDTPLKGTELSQALAQMATGLTDRATGLGFDENGNTPDAALRNADKAKKNPSPPPPPGMR